MSVRTHRGGIGGRILTALVALVLLAAGGIAWLATWAVGNAVEQHLVRERADHAARVVMRMKLPRTPLMARQLAEVSGGEVAIELAPDAVGETMVSSLPPERLGQFRGQMKDRGTLPRTIMLDGKPHDIAAAELRDDAGRTRTLYLLVDRKVVDDARRAALRPMMWGMLGVLVAVLSVGAWVARSITKPIRVLAQQIEGAGTKARRHEGTEGQLGASGDVAVHEVSLDAPRELAELALTYNRMVGRLRDAQARLVETERLAAVGKIAASVAHEVRNPLAGIRMNLQLLEQHLSRRQMRDESLTVVIGEIDRLDAIVQELLMMSRRSEPKMQPVDLKELAGEVLALLHRKLEHARINVAVEGDATTAQADPAQIKQVMLNLLLNAMDAMPQGGGVTIRLTQRDGRAGVQVEDEGGGLKLADGADPFAWFATSKSAGSGIGLALCKQIIEAHGGRIGLEPGAQGARAWFEL